MRSFRNLAFAISAFLLATASICQSIAQDTDPDTPGYLGVIFANVTEEEAKAMNWPRPRGAKVRWPIPGFPGEAAGLQVGDIVVTLDRVEVPDIQKLVTALIARGAGARVELRVLRGGAEHTLNPTLTTRPASASKAVVDLNTRASEAFGVDQVSLGEEALARAKRELGDEHPVVAWLTQNLAEFHRGHGRAEDSERHYKTAFLMFKRFYGPSSADVASNLNGLGGLYMDVGREAESEKLLRQSLEMREALFGPNHSQVHKSVNDLGVLFGPDHLRRLREAEALHERGARIGEAIGPDSWELVSSLTNLGAVYKEQGRFAEATEVYRRCLDIEVRRLGEDHPSTAVTIGNLANIHSDQGRHAEAESLYKKELQILERFYGPDSSHVAMSVRNLGVLYRRQQKYPEALSYLRRWLVLYERKFGPGHSYVANALVNIGLVQGLQRNWEESYESYKRAAAIKLKWELGAEIGRSQETFLGYVRAAINLAKKSPERREALRNEAFLMAQWAAQSAAGTALNRMSARFAAGGDALARLARQRQDLSQQWIRLDKALIASVSRSGKERDAQEEKKLREQLASAEAQGAGIDVELRVKFPRYAALTNPQPLMPREAQRFVRQDEVLVVLALVPEEGYAWVITPSKIRVARLSATPDAIRDLVTGLRCGLDAAAWRDDRAEKCRALLRMEPKPTPNGDVGNLPFDLRQAHRLYQALFSPVEEDIKGKHILLVVPPGPLATLPFSVLVTKAPAVPIPDKVGAYRHAAWLGKRQGITVLPSVSSLRALREFAKTSRASRRFLGIGNPLLEGSQDDPQWGDHYRKLAQDAADRQQCAASLGRREIIVASRQVTRFSRLFQGANADIEAIRRLAPLPETADELCDVGRRLGVPESDILLGERATENRLKALSGEGRLADYSILHFATHGALAGEVRGAAEPGLVLTPPSKDTMDPRALGEDDGFLTASEISTLKLDADWVVLSACNTAGPAGEGADALSGLASAFFHAGARALLVSHWEVGSDAAVKLTTRAFEELRRRKTTRAEALRVSMTELIERGSLAQAHPSQWAPFALVGEGAK